jgi:predicted nuclease of predicted toxin-antitoxin system
VKFLVDAQLPPRLVARLRELGHEALHAGALPCGNQTTDRALAAIADDGGWVVVTKDADFVASQIAFGKPKKLLVVATGNVRNQELVALFEAHHEAVVRAVKQADRVAITRRGLVVQRDD